MNRKRQLSAMAKANRALAQVDRIVAQQEIKFAITEISQAADSTGSLVTLNDIEQGLSDTQRVGDRVTASRLRLNLWRVIPGSASGRFSVRVLVIHDKQNSIDSVSEIFMGTASAYAPWLQFVKDYRLRFTVLYDSLPNHLDQYNKGDCLSWQKRTGIKTQFLHGTDDITTGAIKLVVLSNVSATNNTKPLVIGSVRYDYTDN